jgi:DNA helicase-2/ATP-dependent DNA helicase PcrA
MAIKPTEEQKKIFHTIKNRKESVLIQARAGCGKTTVLVQASKLLNPNESSIFLAFNKHIQAELKQKLPDNFYCSTFHGLGMSAVKRAYPNIELNNFKIHGLVEKIFIEKGIDKKFISKGQYEQYIEYKKNMRNLVDLARQTVTLDKKFLSYVAVKYDIPLDHPDDFTLASKILQKSMEDKKTMDFTDMIFMPVTDPKIWMFQYDNVIVDEVQDLNKAQQKIIEKILKRDKVTKKQTGRFIGVGDENQAIYGFSGTSDKSFEFYRKMKNIKMLPLTTTFRCAKEIVRHAQEIIPDIQYHERAIDGQVREGDVLAEAESGDFILSRTAAPLIDLFFMFLDENKKATIMTWVNL